MTPKKNALKPKAKTSRGQKAKKKTAGSGHKQPAKRKSKQTNSSGMLDLIQSQNIEEIKKEMQAGIATLGNSALVKRIEQLLQHLEQVISKKGSKITHKLEQGIKKTATMARKKTLKKKQSKHKSKSTAKK